MKRSLSLLIAGSLFCVAGVAHAQLGASKRELAARYGAITSTTKEDPTEETITFERPGVLVIASLVNGKCISLTTTSIVDSFSNAEVRRILDSNAQGKHWEQSKESGDFWRRSDGVVAYINPRSIDIVASAAEGSGLPQTEPPKKENEALPQPEPVIKTPAPPQ